MVLQKAKEAEEGSPFVSGSGVRGAFHEGMGGIGLLFVHPVAAGPSAYLAPRTIAILSNRPRHCKQFASNTDNHAQLLAEIRQQWISNGQPTITKSNYGQPLKRRGIHLQKSARRCNLMQLITTRRNTQQEMMSIIEKMKASAPIDDFGRFLDHHSNQFLQSHTAPTPSVVDLQNPFSSLVRQMGWTGDLQCCVPQGTGLQCVDHRLTKAGR